MTLFAQGALTSAYLHAKCSGALFFPKVGEDEILWRVDSILSILVPSMLLVNLEIG